MPSRAAVPVSARCRALKRAGVLRGIALGGVFDGILRHQVVQWHHLLGAVQGPPWPDLRTQLVADGVFNVLVAAGLGCLSWSRVQPFPDAWPVVNPVPAPSRNASGRQDRAAHFSGRTAAPIPPVAA